MAVSDLTNTTWKWKDSGISITNDMVGVSTNRITGNVTCNKGSFTCNMIGINPTYVSYTNRVYFYTYDTSTYSTIYPALRYTSQNGWEYKATSEGVYESASDVVIEVTGGAQATNAQVIHCFETNATQQTTPTGKTQIGTRAITKKMFGTREITKEVVNGVVVYEKQASIMPVKSNIINIDMTGSGTSQQYRVLNINGSVAEVLSMSNATTTSFDSGNTNTYEGKTLDTYLNTTWYNTLSATAKSAIVDKTFRQDGWFINSSGSPVYQGKMSNNKAYKVSLANSSFGNEITRHVYAISVQDVIDYLEVTPQMTQANTTLTYNNIWTMFWNSTTTHNGQIWLRSAWGTSSDTIALYVIGDSGDMYSRGAYESEAVRPAFQIDLTKIDFTIQT